MSHPSDDVVKALVIEVDLGDGVEKLVHFLRELVHDVLLPLRSFVPILVLADPGVRRRPEPSPELETFDHEVHHLELVGLLGDVSVYNLEKTTNKIQIPSRVEQSRFTNTSYFNEEYSDRIK